MNDLGEVVQRMIKNGMGVPLMMLLMLAMVVLPLPPLLEGEAAADEGTGGISCLAVDAGAGSGVGDGATGAAAPARRAIGSPAWRS